MEMVEFKDELVVRKIANPPAGNHTTTDTSAHALIIRSEAELDERGGTAYDDTLVVLLPPNVAVEPGDKVIYAGKTYEVVNMRAYMDLLGEVEAWKITATR